MHPVRVSVRHHCDVRRLAILVALVLLVLPPAAGAASRDVADPSAQPDVPAVTERREIGDVVLLRSWYTSWNGHRRALLISYPRHAPAAGIPLLVTNHPAGMSMICTDRRSLLAARGGYALACISGQGVVTRSFSYGSAGQIADLARAPQVIDARVPDVRIDPSRIFLVGSSMGGTEALLVALRYPDAYDRVVALDPITDLALRYLSLPLNRRPLLEAECGGPPAAEPLCYAVRSPVTLIATATSLPEQLQLWHSPQDPVAGEPRQAPAFAAALAARGLPGFVERTGTWPHGALWDRPAFRRAWLRGLGLPVARRG